MMSSVKFSELGDLAQLRWMIGLFTICIFFAISLLLVIETFMKKGSHYYGKEAKYSARKALVALLLGGAVFIGGWKLSFFLVGLLPIILIVWLLVVGFLSDYKWPTIHAWEKVKQFFGVREPVERRPID